MDKRLEHLTNLVAAAIERSGVRTSASGLVTSPVPQDTSTDREYDPPSLAEAHRIFAARELANAREAGFLLVSAVSLFELAWLYAPLAPSPPPKHRTRKLTTPMTSVDWNRVPNDYDTAEIEQTTSRLQRIQRASEGLEDSYESSTSGSTPASSPPSPPSKTLAQYADCRRTAPLPRTPLQQPPPFDEFESVPIPGYSVLPIPTAPTSPLVAHPPSQPVHFDTPPTQPRSKTRPRILPHTPRQISSCMETNLGALEISRETMTVKRKPPGTKRRALSVSTIS